MNPKSTGKISFTWTKLILFYFILFSKIALILKGCGRMWWRWWCSGRRLWLRRWKRLIVFNIIFLYKKRKRTDQLMETVGMDSVTGTWLHGSTFASLDCTVTTALHIQLFFPSFFFFDFQLTQPNDLSLFKFQLLFKICGCQKQTTNIKFVIGFWTR